MWNLIAWVILGVVAGMIARAIYPGRQGFSLLGTMVLGIIGAFVGGALHSLLTTGKFALATGGLGLGSIIVAVIGALVTLFVYYKVTKPA
ncbi:MAG: GlsB/YeaQ/YmgE family stress response membrane protein [Phormidesmis sp. RL_2_1]|nr:GlsB/YeaQ/YmgE family stress response membrane protein [Phormidesmis sp. RL_2_1]